MSAPLPTGLGRPANRLTMEATAATATGAVGLALLASAVHGFGTPPAVFLSGAYGVYLPFAILIVRHIGASHPYDRFGLPNFVTLARLVLASLFGGLIVELGGQPLAGPTAWIFLAIAVTALALDGIDGILARLRHQVSAFGARFDMEVDTLLILLLSLLAWILDKTGPWVILIGALRYAFVVAGWLWAPLNRPLLPSWRRKAICVVQGASLAALLAPAVASPASDAVAAGALALILYSFAVDIRWLFLHRSDA